MWKLITQVNVEETVDIHHPPLKYQFSISCFLSKWIIRRDLIFTFANICNSTTIINEPASAIYSPVTTGGALLDLDPPNKTTNLPKLKYETL